MFPANVQNVSFITFRTSGLVGFSIYHHCLSFFTYQKLYGLQFTNVSPQYTHIACPREFFSMNTENMLPCSQFSQVIVTLKILKKNTHIYSRVDQWLWQWTHKTVTRKLSGIKSWCLNYQSITDQMNSQQMGPSINQYAASMSMSVMNLYSAESWSISTALCVLSGNAEISSSSTVVGNDRCWAPGYGDCPAVNSSY